MPAYVDKYVDSDIGGSSGSGTSGDPYSDLQYAMNQTTKTSAGTRFLGKGSEVLSAALDFSTHGAPAFNAPIIFERWDADWDISGGGTVAINTNTSAGLYFYNIRMHNTGSNAVLQLGQYSAVVNCEIDNSTGDAIDLVGLGCVVHGCNIHNIGGNGVHCSAQTSHYVMDNYFANGTNDFSAAIRVARFYAHIARNIMSIDGTSDGINATSNGYNSIIEKNSILSAGGTGAGIEVNGIPVNGLVVDNVVEGFNGTGGKGIDINANTHQAWYAGNHVYNCATNYTLDSDHLTDLNSDNEDRSAGGSPFAKSGSDTFANRFTYFAPADVGNMIGGAYLGGSMDKGAVQRAEPAGGGGYIRRTMDSMIGR